MLDKIRQIEKDLQLDAAGVFGRNASALPQFTSDVFVRQKSRIPQSDDMVFAYIVEQ
ncbi:MAG: hypothetical protein NT163_02875 [Chlorobiales bacterium]|nr:hypothetical protein [Chlorobiales bacterium]